MKGKKSRQVDMSVDAFYILIREGKSHQTTIEALFCTKMASLPGTGP